MKLLPWICKRERSSSGRIVLASGRFSLTLVICRIGGWKFAGLRADWGADRDAEIQGPSRLAQTDTTSRLVAQACPNQPWVRRQYLTSISITGTSISTPTTVARAAPEERPKSMTAVAMATSKWFEAPIMADGAASS